jgi:hypothetical protein
MNTNGGLRTKFWWQELANIMKGELDYAVFSIDGLADTNHIYRVDVNWDNVMSNAEAFISAGYEELMTYMPIADEEPSGKSRRDFNLGDEDTVRSAVLNHKVERRIADLQKLFEDII